MTKHKRLQFKMNSCELRSREDTGRESRCEVWGTVWEICV